MTLVDFLVDGFLVAAMAVMYGIALCIVGFVLYSALMYIGCKIPSVPLEQKGKDIYWKGKLKHENNDDDISDNGYVVLGAIVTWIGIIVSVLIFIGYLANQYGVNPV